MFTDVQVNVVLIAIAVALVQIIKQVPGFEGRDWLKSILALAVGVGLVWLDSAPPVRQMILEGLVVGLSASGLYTGSKAGIKAIKE